MTAQRRLDRKEITSEDFSRIHMSGGLREQVLVVLWVCRERAKIDVLTPHDISLLLRDHFGITASRQAIEAVLSKERGTVAKRMTNKRRAYQIMQKGIDEVAAPRGSVTFIDPRQSFSSLRNVQAVMSEFTGDLRICDPYVDSHSLDLLASCSGASTIDLLTVNVRNERSWRREATAFVAEHGLDLSVRVLPDGKLHDRYVIHRSGIALFGTSLNGVGKKQSFVVELGLDIRNAVMSTFEDYWIAATPL